MVTPDQDWTGANAAPSRFAELWTLDPSVAYLNHGSFGACPRAILEHQAELRRALEREPVDFLVRELPRRLAETRAALAPFVGANPADLAFVSNATAGVNTVLRSLALEPGDELLTTDHAYGGCRKALQHAADRAGALVRVAALPFPLAGEDEIVGPVLDAVTPRTRLALLDHVTSVTGLVFPIERLVRELLCAEAGTPAPSPAAMIGALASVPLPPAAAGSPGSRLDAEGLATWFRERRIETFLHPWPGAGGRVIRASAQLYNSREQFVALAAALREALR